MLWRLIFPRRQVFHLMRSTEAVLRQYHRQVKALPVGTRSPEMAQCINELGVFTLFAVLQR